MPATFNAFFISDFWVIVIVLLTALTSIYAFYHQKIYFLFVLHPYSIIRNRKLYTLFTAAFVHTGWFHLLFNLVIIYFLGRTVEKEFMQMGNHGGIKFVLLYFFSVLIGNYGSVLVHRKDFSYRSAGASTGALAILGSFCILKSAETYLSLPLIGAVANSHVILVLILVFVYELKKGRKDYIDHYAHLFGILSGMVITILFYPDVLVHLRLN